MMESFQELGLLGLFLSSFLAATIVPLSSEIVLSALLLSGIDPLGALVVAICGNWLGGITTYLLGRLGRWSLIERWFKVKRETLEREKRRVERWGALLAFITWFPLIGDLLFLALGFYRVNFSKCALYSLMGRSLRFGVWVLLFELMGRGLFNFSIL
ncbi:MAG: VTT domain-containing protein [Bacteroidales bacterium]